MLSNFTGWHALIVLIIIVLLFGATKLPGLAKSVGQSMKIFKNEVKGPEDVAVPPPASPMSAPGVRLNDTSDEVRAQTEAAKHNTP